MNRQLGDNAQLLDVRRRLRLSNLPRLLIAVVCLAWFSAVRVPALILESTIVLVVYSLAWTILVETGHRIILFEFGRYARILVDALGLTVLVAVTGGSISPAIVTYIGTTGIASLQIDGRYGIFSIFCNFVLFNLMNLLVILQILPQMNILAGFAGSLPQGPGTATLIFSNVLMILYSVVLYFIVHPNYKKLHAERARLRQKNEIMENEISLARKIQENLIPARSPGDNIAFLYRPMHQVGGDYLDFPALEQPGETAVFISDVSGHGVPAALIASMLKTIVLQSGSIKNDPARLLAYVNETLTGLTAGNFVTAFYLIYNAGTREIRYAGAGHPPPYVIGQSVAELSVRPSLPLGLWDNAFMNARGKSYETVFAHLPVGSGLLLYTDGLTEASSDGSPLSSFGDVALDVFLRDHRSLGPSDLVRGLHQALVDFRGADSFEDDVCIVSMQT